MPIFQYIAKDSSGKAVTGTIESSSEVEIARLLHTKGLFVVSVKETKGKVVNYKIKNQPVKLEDLVIFSRQLATMIDAGIPLVQSLTILMEQIDNKSLRNTISVVRQDIQGGTSFCDALAKHPKVFSELFINMCRAGEASGMLDQVLDRMATYLEKSAQLQRKVKSSLVYPAVVISMVIIITAVLLLKVVPTFKSIFDSLGGKLPMPTQVLIFISDLLRKYFLYTVIVLVFLAVAFKKYISTPKGRYNFDKMLLFLPGFGTLFQKVAMAKFSRTFSTLIKSGVPVLNALEIVAKTAGNKVVEETITNCRAAVRSGESISQPLLKSKIFPPLVCRMIEVGEQTGQLEKMLSKVADFYDSQVDAAVSGLTSLIEPMVIALMGVIIGGIVIALFLPIFKISELVSK